MDAHLEGMSYWGFSEPNASVDLTTSTKTLSDISGKNLLPSYCCILVTSSNSHARGSHIAKSHNPELFYFCIIVSHLKT